MTLKELSEYPVLENGTVVKVKVGDDIFQGKIVGQGAVCLNPLYLVECTDGFIPNNTYRYKTCTVPLSEMIFEDQCASDLNPLHFTLEGYAIPFPKIIKRS